MITNQQLRDTFLSAPMKYYFDKKLAPLSSDEVTVRIEELLKWLNMSAFCLGDIPFTLEIDEVWHYWIMETAEYAKLCDKLHGRKFIHHSSSDYAEYFDQDAKKRNVDFEKGVGILSSYVLNYGPFAAERIRYWPLAERIIQDMQWSVDELNEWLKTGKLPEKREALAAA